MELVLAALIGFRPAKVGEVVVGPPLRAIPSLEVGPDSYVSRNETSEITLPLRSTYFAEVV